MKQITSFLFLLCTGLIFISCNKSVYFFSQGIEGPTTILDRPGRKLFSSIKEYERPVMEEEEYQPPPPEEWIVLNGQADFIQLAGAPQVEELAPQIENGISFSVMSNNSAPAGGNAPTLETVQPSLPVVNVPLPSQKPLELVNERGASSLEEQVRVEDVHLAELSSNGQTEISLSALQGDLSIPSPETPFIPRPLDIFFVVDTSASMNQHLIDFKQKFAGFLNHLSGLDWRLAVTNADLGETGFFLFNAGALNGRAMNMEKEGIVLDIRHIHPDVAGYNRIFLDTISKHENGVYTQPGLRDRRDNVHPCALPPYCQSYQEQPLKALQSAFSVNPDFFRKEADLAVVITSNSPEQAHDPDEAVTPEEVIAEFRNVYGEQKRFEVYGIIITEDDEECLNQNIIQQFLMPEGDFSREIASLSDMTDGRVFSICSSHYRELAQSVVDSFSQEK